MRFLSFDLPPQLPRSQFEQWLDTKSKQMSLGSLRLVKRTESVGERALRTPSRARGGIPSVREHAPHM